MTSWKVEQHLPTWFLEESQQPCRHWKRESKPWICFPDKGSHQQSPKKRLLKLTFAELVEIVVNVTIVVGTMVTMRVIRVVDVTVIVDVSVNISESFKLTEASLNNPPLAATNKLISG